MEKVLNKFYSLEEKIGKHNIMLVLFIFIVSLITGLYTTFSIFTSTEPVEIVDGLPTYKFILDNQNLSNSITVAANTSKGLEVTVLNKSNSKLKYGLYYSSDDYLEGVDVGYTSDSEYASNGLINGGDSYVVNIKIVNDSNYNVTIDLGLAFGMEKGGDLVLESGKHWVGMTRPVYLKEAQPGSYVKYTGNNGCSGDSCDGVNANYDDGISNGFCADSSYEYNSNGWMVAYTDNDNAHIVSAGAVECMCSGSDGTASTSSCSSGASANQALNTHFTNLDNMALKYCNEEYASGGKCNSSTAWSIDGADFEKITGNNLSNSCWAKSENTSCGYNNSIIDNGGYYWFASTYESSSTNSGFSWFANNRYAEVSGTNVLYGVRPVIKMDTDVIVTGGSGTEEDPYILGKKQPYLNEMEVGSYVKYVGSNGCTGSACAGQNANYINSSDKGYCYAKGNGESFDVSGWRIAYKKNGIVYLISAGAPECMCMNSDGTTSSSSCSSNTTDYDKYLGKIEEITQKYCNPNYVYGGKCDNTTTWSFNANDFEQITGSKLYYNSATDKSCHGAIDVNCGYENDLINNGSYYRISGTFVADTGNKHAFSWNAYAFYVVGTFSNISLGIRPVIKLDPMNVVTGGSGTESNPYTIVNNDLNKDVYNYYYTGDVQKFVAEETGTYKIEAWGAQGGHYDATHSGGKGAYTSGEIELEKGTNLYIYVGGYGSNNSTYTNVGGFNGGGYSGTHASTISYGGGGATDIRLVSGSWNNFDSLKSRIMVAAGGGGTGHPLGTYTTQGGYGGTLTGGNAVGTYTATIPTGATQTSTGAGYSTEKLGFFGYATQSNTSGWGGGGGGGYYGGVAGHGHGGSGGSSFISGHTGCNAISESSTSSSITHLGVPEHYSGYVFTNTSMIAGNASMPSYSTGVNQTGNEGNGFARITYIG